MKSRFFLPLLALSLIAGCANAQNAAEPGVPVTAVAPALPFEKEIIAYEAADAKEFPAKGGVVFIGSSSIRLWKTLKTDFPAHNVLNRGFGGSQIRHATAFIDRIVVPYAPKQIIFYSGGNDINAKRMPEQVLADWKEFAEKVHAKLPDTKIAYISIVGAPSRWTQVEQVKTANAMIEAYIKTQPHMTFINVFPLMMNEQGTPRMELFSKDNLHMNPEGYKLWQRVVGPYLVPTGN